MEELQMQILKYMDKWMTLRENGISVTKYCEEMNAEIVAIYGYGKLGRHLLWELQDNGLYVPWIMDRKYDKIELKDRSVKVLSPSDCKDIPKTDMVIVTALGDFREIEAELSKHIVCTVVSFKDILDRIEEKYGNL